ncbi:MAG: class I SAM-dependent methyltransferase [Acidimicrobiales bacterium]
MLRAFGATPSGIEQYLDSARTTVDAVTRLARLAGADIDAGRWLEIGAGYGRLLRVLAERVPSEQLTAIELDPSAVRFCQNELGVATLRSNAAFEVITGSTFDVVFAISVITHVDWEGSQRFLRLGCRSLAPGGAFVFSTHGRRALDELEENNPTSFGGVRADIEAAWAGPGFSYSPYRSTRGDYGMTWHRPDVIATLVSEADPDVEIVAHEPSGLLDYQDLWVLRRPARRRGTGR